MPSLRQKVTTYFRQLSFIADPRENGGGPHSSRSGFSSSRKGNDEDGNFIIKYLENRTDRNYIDPGPDIISGHEPHEMPDLPIAPYPTGTSTITAACTGPDEGLTGIKRSKLHLSAGSDIDFIDTIQDQEVEIRKSISNHNKFKLNYSQKSRNAITSGDQLASSVTTVSITSDQNANKTSRSKKNPRLSTNTYMPATSNTENSVSNYTNKLNAKTDENKIESEKKSESESAQKYNDANKLTDNIKRQPTTIYVSMVSTSSTNSPKTPTKISKQNNQTNINISNNAFSKTEGLNNIKMQTITSTTQLIPAENSETDAFETIKLTTTEVTNTLTDILTTKNKIDEKQNEIINSNMLETKAPNALENTKGEEEKENLSNNILGGKTSDSDIIAGVSNWKMESEHAYGISVSLYEYNMLTKESMGSPIADCYGMVVRGNACAMAIADGVNWGDGARLAARSAVHGSLDYLDRALFSFTQEYTASSTKDVFISLFRALWEGHDCILEVGGALSTLTIAIILPLGGDQYNGKYVVCACNVGDSLGYIYSKKYGVREFTQGSHDITSMRDMRDALGALGPVDGNKPELSNLTLSMTVVETGDIVFLTSDGISDNFDPVVGKFAEAWTTETKIRSQELQSRKLAPKRQNRSAAAVLTHSTAPGNLNRSNEKLSNSCSNSNTQQPYQIHEKSLKTSHNSNIATRSQQQRPIKQKSPIPNHSSTSTSSTSQSPGVNNPLEKTKSSANVPSRPKYIRSHTVIEPRITKIRIPRSAAGLPLVTGPQRHALTILRLEDLLSYGINGQLCPCPSARRLCHLLVDFVRMITSARRKTLEQRELFYKVVTAPDGSKREVEMTRIQHRSARKRIVDSSTFGSLPGKLDHASVVAYTVGSGLQTKEFKETNF